MINEQQINVLEQIWKGKAEWNAESEATLNALAAQGYIEIVRKPDEAQPGATKAITVKITDEGAAHLSGSGY